MFFKLSLFLKNQLFLNNKIYGSILNIKCLRRIIMSDQTSKKYLYASLAIGVIGIIFSLIAPSPLSFFGAILVAIGTAGGVLVWKYGYLIIPLITQRTKTVMITAGGYEIPPSQDVIVKNSDGVFYATAFLGLKIYESMTEKATEEAIAYNKYFERAISNLKYVTKISYLLYVEDIRKKRQMIETRRAEAQLRLSRERDKPQPDPLKIDRYEQDFAFWDSQLQKLVKGVKPMGVIAYVQTTAVGISEEAAIARVRSQTGELKTLLSNALNVEVVNLQADEMLKCFEWELFYPTSIQELEDSTS